MSEDRTRDLPDARSFEERVLAEFVAQREFNAQLLDMVQQLNARLTTLEDKVERRLMETRPIWEAMQAQLNDVQSRLISVEAKVDDMQEQLLHIDSKVGSIDVQMGELAVELLSMRGDNRGMQKRMVRLEKLQPQS
jgi:predicted  nucleic acid-binding Zn-ribbon protein